MGEQFAVDKTDLVVPGVQERRAEILTRRSIAHKLIQITNA